MSDMDRMRYVEPQRRDEIILEAARRRSPLVLTRRESRDWTSHKSHFVGASDDRSHLLIAASAELVQARSGPPVRGERVGVAFRRGHRKCMFSAVVEEIRGPATTLVVQWPEQIQELQRRAYYRSAPPKGITLPVRFWIAGARPHTALSPPPEDAFLGTLLDLSAGGIRINVRDNPLLEVGQTVLCHFAYKRGAPPLTLEGTLRHRQPESHSVESLGFQFIGLETTPSGQKTLVRLAKIVAEFQQSNYRTNRRARQPEMAFPGV